MIDQDLLNTLYPSQVDKLSRILQTTPQYVRPVVTQSDADAGYIIRYFIRQANDKGFIVEVDNNQYQRFKENPRFIGTEIRWKIVGKLDTIKYSNGANLYGVGDVNKITVAEADLTFGGLRNYISNYVEFWLREK